MKTVFFYLLFLFMCYSFINIAPVHAATTAADSFTFLGQPVNTSTLDGFISLAIIISKFILGITGSLALLAFVYGGFVFLLSGGSAQNVEKGKNILKAAIIGLIIVFASFTIIKFILKSMGLNWDGGTVTTASTTTKPDLS